ncbi:hypothetical protein CLCAR_3227 [Clostridium carboxidivorans P7]|nr:hypothetical protein CLCAR_3227 [Clostridium carboxidivorans P7]
MNAGGLFQGLIFFMQFLLNLFSMQIKKEGLAVMKNIIT